jgi:DNA-binding Lrp family transcriptional regulator
MVQNVKLTARDLAVLRGCYGHTVLSYSQIQGRYFPGRSRPTVSNRLGRLVRAGYLRKYRVGLPLLMGRQEEVGVVFQAARRAHKVLKLCGPDSPIRDEPVRFNASTLVHDLVLNDVMAALEKRFPRARITHGKLIQQPQTKGGRLPDAVLEMPSLDGLVAIELELTGKSNDRYRDIILQYLTSDRYEQVLYVMAGQAIAPRLRYLITNQREVPGADTPSTGKFFFTDLTKLLDGPTTAVITNGSDEPLVP